MDFSDGLTKTLATGRSSRFLDLGHITFFADGNNKVSLDLRTGATTPTNGADDDTAFFEQREAARFTTPDGFRITYSTDPAGTALPRGGATSRLVKVVDTRNGTLVREFRAFAAVPAGRGAIAVAAPARSETVNIFLVQIAIGQAEFISTTRLSAPNFPFAADDSRVIWTDGYCSEKPGSVFVFERKPKKLIEVDTGGRPWWASLTPSGQIALGDFGADSLLDPVTFATVISLPEKTGPGSSDIAWTPDYRFAAYGSSGGHGGLC